MDVGSKEVLMESPPVSVMCVCVCACMWVVGPASSNCFPHPSAFIQPTQTALSEGRDINR